MLETISIILGAFGLVSFFRVFGLFLGIGLILLWITRIKNTTALFYDKGKIRSTLFFGVPGLLSLILWAIFRFAVTPSYDYDSSSYSSDYPQEDYIPTLAYMHIVNKSEKPGKLRYGDTEETIAAGEWKKIIVKSKEPIDSIRAWLGDSLVFDTIVQSGTYIANFSSDVTAIAEEIIYSSNSTASTDDLEYIMLTEPGIRQFSHSVLYDVYDFDETAPSTISMPKYSSSVKKWDLSLASSEELMEMLLKALKEEGGDVEMDYSEEED